MSTAIYLRISDKDQNPEGQRQELQQWVEHNKPKAVEWYEDHQTGKNLDRPAFHKLENDIRRGKVKTVVVWKLDRLSRSMRDGINLVTDWIERGVRIISITQSFDWSGSLGKMVAGILFAFAEMERDARAAGSRDRGCQSQQEIYRAQSRNDQRQARAGERATSKKLSDQRDRRFECERTYHHAILEANRLRNNKAPELKTYRGELMTAITSVD